MSLFRPTLRVRMALLYGALVVLVGIALLATSYILIGQSVGNAPQRDAILQTFIQQGLIFFAIIVVIGTVGGYLLARQSLRPIARLTQTARLLSTENLDQRINLGGPEDELRELADTFDEMLGRLDSAFDSQRLFVANASHELRTPLSVIRTELDVTLSDPDADAEELRRMGGVVVAQATERAQRLVTSLLTLARLQAVGGKRPRGERAGRSGLAGPVGDQRGRRRGRQEGRQDRDRGRGGRHRRRSEAARAADRQPRRERHPAQRPGRLAAHHHRPVEPASVWLKVANGGAVINNEDVERLFEPFRRGGPRRVPRPVAPGSASRSSELIVETHGGKLRGHRAAVRGGLSIRIELPRAPDDPTAIDAAGQSGSAQKGKADGREVPERHDPADREGPQRGEDRGRRRAVRRRLRPIVRKPIRQAADPPG